MKHFFARVYHSLRYVNVIMIPVILILILTHLSYNMEVPCKAFHINGVPNRQLQDVFNHLGMPISSLKEANNFAQKHLLRTGEREDKQEEKEVHIMMQTNKKLLINDLKHIGMIDEIVPTKKSYAYALLMGAMTKRVSMRLDYLAHLVRNECKIDTIVLLGGERPLRDGEKEGLPNDVTTEAQMMVHLFKSHQQLKNYPMIVVNAPMIVKEDGATARPTTDSTIAYFAHIAPAPGNCLVISNNPYIRRQTKVTQRILNQTKFPTDGAGQAATQETMDNIIMLMDEFARTLYEETK